MNSLLPRIAALLALVLASGCDSGPGGDEATRLHQHLIRAGRVELEAEGVEGRALAALEQAERRWNQARSGHGGRVRVVAGRAGSARIGELLGGLGFSVDGTRVDADGRQVETANDALLLVYADPARAGQPLTVAVGEPDVLEAVAPQLAPGWRPELCVWRRGIRVLEARLSTRGRVRWGTAVEHAPRWARMPESYRRMSAPGVIAFVERNVSTEAAEDYFSHLARVQSTLAERYGFEAPASMQVVLEGSIEGGGTLGAVHQLASVEPGSGTVVATLARGAPHDAGLAHGVGTLERAVAGGALAAPAAHWWIHAAALDAADSWFGRPLEEWGAFAARAAEGVPCEELLEPDALVRHSPHLVLPLRALALRAVREARTAAGEAHSSSTGSEELLSALPALQLRLTGSPRPADARSLLVEGERHRGARLLAPLFSGVDGAPGSLAFDAALDQLRAARALEDGQVVGPSADLVLLDVAGVNAPGMGSGRALVPPARLGLECGDAAFVVAVAHAHTRGLRLLVVPHLLSAPEGTFHGELKRTRPGEWKTFFDDYDRFLVHAALTAELAGAQALAVGAGLEGATRIEDEAVGEVAGIKSARWLASLARARACFRGSLTWVARDVRTLARLDFADRLDFLSSELHPRLGFRPGLEAASAADGPAELSARQVPARLFGILVALTEHARSLGKPLVIAGAGLPATTTGWRGLHGGAGPVSAERARAFLQDLAEALERMSREGETPAGLALDGWGTRSGAGASRAAPLDLRGLGLEPLVGQLLLRR